MCSSVVKQCAEYGSTTYRGLHITYSHISSRLSQGHNDYHKLITIVLSAQGGPLADSKSIEHDLDVGEVLGDH